MQKELEAVVLAHIELKLGAVAVISVGTRGLSSEWRRRAPPL